MPPIEEKKSIDSLNTYTVDRKFLGFIYLNPSFTIPNFISYLFCVFFAAVFVLFLNAIQPFLLRYKLEITEGLSNNNDTLSLTDEVVFIIFVCVWGILSDKLGRRIVFSLGFVLVGIALLLFTIPNRVFPDLILIRLLFAIGAAACTAMVTAGLVDIVGKRNGTLVGIMGAVTAVLLLLPIPGWLANKVTTQSEVIVIYLYIVGAVAIAWGIITFFTYRKQLSPVQTTDITLGMEVVAGGIKILKGMTYLGKDFKVAMSYISGFVARGSTITLTAFISLWVVKFYSDNGKCSSNTQISYLGNDDVTNETCPEAFLLALTLSATTQVCALIAAPIIGLILLKVKPSLVLSASSLLSVIGYFSFGFSTDPTSKILYLFLSLLGVGEMGTIVTSLSFLSEPETIPTQFRGTVSGIYSLFGGLGVLICSKLGGYLFEVWGPSAPFIVMGVFHLILMILAGAAYFFDKEKLNNYDDFTENAFTSQLYSIHKTVFRYI